MSFDRLQARVARAERLVQAREERAVAQGLQLRDAWRALWTPGRIVVAGLASGFLVGRAEPLKLAARSGQWMQLVSLLSGLAAGVVGTPAASVPTAADEPDRPGESDGPGPPGAGDDTTPAVVANAPAAEPRQAR